MSLKQIKCKLTRDKIELNLCWFNSKDPSIIFICVTVQMLWLDLVIHWCYWTINRWRLHSNKVIWFTVCWFGFAIDYIHICWLSYHGELGMRVCIMGVSSQDLLSQKRAKSPSFVLIRPILYKIQPLNNSRNNNLLIWTSHQVNYFVNSQVLEWLYLV